MLENFKCKSDNSLELIGGTPLVKLNKVVPANGSNIFVKLESTNPGGSVKDRIALSMVEDAEKQGLLKPGATIIEPTSGNTGIGLALVGAVKGYKVILVMSENMSMERRAILESYGAIIDLSRAEFGMQGTIERAEELLAANPEYYMPQQFNNPSNPEVHRQTTGPEIISAMEGEAVDAFVSGIGTGGTISGTGEVLKEHFGFTKIVGVEPATSAVLSGKPPGPHKIQGIGAGFHPKVLNMDIVDDIRPISDGDAFRFTQRLAKEEGLLVGISSGAALCAAYQLAGSAPDIQPGQCTHKVGISGSRITLAGDTTGRNPTVNTAWRGWGDGTTVGRPMEVGDHGLALYREPAGATWGVGTIGGYSGTGLIVRQLVPRLR